MLGPQVVQSRRRHQELLDRAGREEALGILFGHHPIAAHRQDSTQSAILGNSSAGHEKRGQDGDSSRRDRRLRLQSLSRGNRALMASEFCMM